ncbi:MAG: iron ABC transporter substrate-binding protein [Actinomycetota bacterium]
MPTNKVAAIFFSLAFLLPISACGSSQESTTTNQETSALVIYSGRSEELVGGIIDEFEKSSGHQVEVRYGDTAEMAAQLREEGDRTPANLFFSQDAGALGALEKANLLAPLKEEPLNQVPAQYRSISGRWIGVTGRARVVAYDPKQVAEAELPDDVTQFTDKKWRGKIAIAPTNASFQSFVTALRVSRGEKVAEDFLRGLVANDAVIYEKNSAIVDDLEAGKATVGLINHYYLKEVAAEVGAENVRTQLKFLPPGTAGSLVNVAGVGVLAGSVDSTPAMDFVEYLLQQKTQKAFVDKTGEYPLVTGVEGPPGLPSLTDLGVGAGVELNQLAGIEETVQLLTKVGLI